MADNSANFVGSIPDNYDAGLGPHIFIDFAEEIARRAAALRPKSVLELAAGTGIVTGCLRNALPTGTEIVATDLNPPMLEVARSKLGEGNGLSFTPADATGLTFEDNSFDVIVCQFGVMFFPDKERSYCEALRVLKPGGRYLFNTWDSWAHNPFAELAHQTVATFFGDDPPQFYSVPFSYHDTDEIRNALKGAGFTDIEFERVCIDKEIVSVELFAKGVIQGNPISEEIANRGGVEPEDVMAAICDAYGDAFGGPPGRMPLQSIFVSARKP